MMSERILIVEDDPMLVDTIRRNLTARGYAVESAANAREATEAIDEACPDLLLLDIDLPDQSGWELLRAVRTGRCSDVATIVLSGLRPNDRLVTQLHCAAVLEKPFPIASLLRLVDAALEETRRSGSIGAL